MSSRRSRTSTLSNGATMTTAVGDQESIPDRAESAGPTFVLSQRQTVRILLSLIIAVPFVIAVMALIDGWQLLGDNAIIGLRVRNLITGDLPLTGLPSTGQNFGTGIESNHPGPLALYFLVPFVVVFGPTAGMAFGAAAINASAFGLAAWAGFRRGGVFLLTVVGLVLCVLARGLSPWTLIDPLSSNLGTFPSVAYALLAWAVLAGDRKLLPVTIAVGTFTLQAHLTYMAFGGGVTAVLALGLLTQWLSDRRNIPDRRTLIWSGVVGLVMWAPLLIDEFFGEGNISSIVRTFTASSGDPGMGWDFALRRLVRAVSVPPFFGQYIRGLDFLRPTPFWGIVLALPVVALVGLRLWQTRRGQGSAPLVLLTMVTIGVGLVSVYSASQLPSGATVKAANLRWMWTFGALWWLTALWALVGLLLDKFGRPKPQRIVPVLIGVAVLGMSMVVIQAEVRPARDARAFGVARELSDAADKVPKGSYRIQYTGSKALVTVGPSFAYALRSAGSKVYVDAGIFGRGYGSSAIYTNQKVDGTYLVMAGPKGEVTLPLGYKVILKTSYHENGQLIETVLATAKDSDEATRRSQIKLSEFCAQTSSIDQKIQGFAAALGPAASQPLTASQGAELMELLNLKDLNPSEAPAEISGALSELLATYDQNLAKLRAAEDKPLLEVIDPKVLANMAKTVTFWLDYCK